jgi:hypothetical protein
MEAVKQHPIFGAGYGRFAVVYGDAQREYFLSSIRPENQAIMADSPEYAFNEFVQIIVELGGFGLLLFMLLTGSLFVSRHTSFSSYHASFISVLVLAFFSYPFSVLPLVIIFLFILTLSAPSSKKISFNLPIWLHISSMVVFVGVITYGVFQIFHRQKMYREWTMAQTVYHAKAYQQIYPKYSSLYPYLQHEKQFLFEYDQCLSNADRYAESNRIFEEYLFYGSDPMVFNCMGNNFKAMGEYGKAEGFYIRSSQTVLNRHYPIYLLMKLYEKNGQTEKAKAMAGVLLAKPVKIKSTAIQEMRDYAIKVVAGD